MRAELLVTFRVCMHLNDSSTITIPEHFYLLTTATTGALKFGTTRTDRDFDRVSIDIRTSYIHPVTPPMFSSQRFTGTPRKRYVHETRRSRAPKEVKTAGYASLQLRSVSRTRKSLTRWFLIALCTLISSYLLYTTTTSLKSNSASKQRTSPMRVLQPHSNTRQQKHDPEKWLRDHSDMYHYETGEEKFNDRPKAAIISLVRNEELEGILQSMRQLEQRWNRRYNYPWMFFSEREFSEEFKVSFSRNLASTSTPLRILPSMTRTTREHSD